MPSLSSALARIAKTSKIYVLLLASCLLPVLSLAQSPRIRDTNANGWFMFYGDHKLSPTWGVHTEFQARRYNVITAPQQLVLRLAANYSLSSTSMVALGYGFVKSHPYGDFPAPGDSHEHRIYEQLQLQGKLSRIALSHRYRLEQRWVENLSLGQYLYQNRVRYQLRGTVPLQGPTLDPKEVFVSAYDEIFIGFGNNVPNIFDQNRTYAAAGYKLSKEASVEGGYMLQILQQRNQKIWEHNHTLQMSLTYNFDFTR